MIWIINTKKLESMIKWARDVDKKMDSINLSDERGLSPKQKNSIWFKKIEARINIGGRISFLERNMHNAKYHVFIGSTPKKYFEELRRLDFELASFYNI